MNEKITLENLDKAINKAADKPDTAPAETDKKSPDANVKADVKADTDTKTDIKADTQADIKADIKTEEAQPIILPDPQIDALGRAYATGKRKNATARVWIKRGSGKITVNGRDEEIFFARPVLRMSLRQSLVAADRADSYDMSANVRGGGLSGQAGAIRHGISKALTYYEPELRSVLKAGGFLTRDSRIVERKKYGRAKARRSFQFSKR